MAYTAIDLPGGTSPAQERAAAGLPPDPFSDRLWQQRLADAARSGPGAVQATYTEMVRRLNEKAAATATPAPSPGGVSGDNQDPGILAPAAPVTPATPQINYAAETAGLFPWLTGELRDLFIDFWSETGTSSAALGKLRGTGAYQRAFPGNMRPDGTLRYDENQYLAERFGVAEALAEFGFSAGTVSFPDLLERGIDSRELFGAAQEAVTRFREPGAQADNGLADAYLQQFAATGSQSEALDRVRDSSAWDNVFAGNRREDGSLRMDEPEYFAYKRGWDRLFLSRNLNPEPFKAMGRDVESIRSEKSIQELDADLTAVERGILGNTQETQQFFLDSYGVEGVNFLATQGTFEAALALAIDPKVGGEMLKGRITAAQIGGEAAIAGFSRRVERAEQLAAAGVGQSQARELYTGAARSLDALSATTQRFNRGGTSLEQYEGAFALGDAEEGLRLERALRSEQSSFSSRSDVRRDRSGFGLAGLRQR